MSSIEPPGGNIGRTNSSLSIYASITTVVFNEVAFLKANSNSSGVFALKPTAPNASANLTKSVCLSSIV